MRVVNGPIERLSPEDRIMLWGDEIWPQDIGALALLDGRPLLAPDGRFRIEAVREAIEPRLHLVPRFRQLLYEPRRGLGGPLWVDAPHLDLADHLRVLPLPDPASEVELLAAVEGLRRRRLDRSRPLWEMWFLPGLPAARVGLFVRIHHVIADATAGVATLGALLDPTAEATVEPAPPWVPSPPPPARDLLEENLRRRAGELGHVPSSLARPVTAWRRGLTAWRAMREFLAEGPAPQTSLDRVAGLDRTLALIRTPLDSVREVADCHDATVNDVLLAATAGGLRRLLYHREEPVEDTIVRIAVPVSLRRHQGGGTGGNLVGEMVVPLPVGGSHPSGRLRRIAAETARRKARTPPTVGTLLGSRIARRAVRKAIDRQRVNVASADVAGPPMPLYLAGARLLEMFPVLALVAKASLGVGAMSYAGRFNIGLVADRGAYPDLAVFATGMREELGTLGVTIAGAPMPEGVRP